MSAIIVAMSVIRAGRGLVSQAADFTAIGRRIVAARMAREMRATDLAAHLGIGTNVLAMWENGQRRPHIEHAAMLIAALGITSDWLYFGEDRGLDWQLRDKLLANLDRLAEEPDAHRLRRKKLSASE